MELAMEGHSIKKCLKQFSLFPSSPPCGVRTCSNSLNFIQKSNEDSTALVEQVLHVPFS